MPIICEAVERAAVANGRKNFVDRGPRRYESSPGELLPQTLPSEPSTAVVEQHADPLPDQATASDSHHALHMLTLAGSAGLHGHRSMRWSEMASSSCLCERGRRCSSKTRPSSAARAPHRTSADCPRGTPCARHLGTLRAACAHAQRTQSERCVVLCSIDGCERALESNLSRVCRYRYICKCIYTIQHI